MDEVGDQASGRSARPGAQEGIDLQVVIPTQSRNDLRAKHHGVDVAVSKDPQLREGVPLVAFVPLGAKGGGVGQSGNEQALDEHHQKFQTHYTFHE